MRRTPALRLLCAWAALCALLALPFTAAQEVAAPDANEESYGKTPARLAPYSRTNEPYRRFYLDPPAFRGPGRDEPPPADLGSIRVGLLAPIEKTDGAPAGLGLLRGAELAFAEANAAGGYRGLRVRAGRAQRPGIVGQLREYADRSGLPRGRSGR